MLKLQENEEEWNNIMKQQKADKKAKMNKPQNKLIKQVSVKYLSVILFIESLQSYLEIFCFVYFSLCMC